jgi:hypothetical protein
VTDLFNEKLGGGPYDSASPEASGSPCGPVNRRRAMSGYYSHTLDDSMAGDAEPNNVKRFRVIWVVTFNPVFLSIAARAAVRLFNAPISDGISKRIARLIFNWITLAPRCRCLNSLLPALWIILVSLAVIFSWSITLLAMPSNITLGAFLAFIKIPIRHLFMLVKLAQ